MVPVQQSASVPRPAAAHPDADEIVAAHVAMRRILIPSEQLWRFQRPGVIASSTGIDCSTCNTIYVHDGAAGLGDVASAMRELDGRGVSFQMTVRSSIAAGYEGVAHEHGLAVLAELPLMVLKPDNYRPGPIPEELRIRRLEPDAEPFHLDLVAEGLGMSREGIGFLMSREHMASQGWSTYVGEVDGVLAVTGSSIANDGYVALISIVTDPAFRRRGYGSALVSASISDAFEEGATRIFLHSSEQGYGVYESLGFETVEHLCIFARPEEGPGGH